MKILVVDDSRAMRRIVARTIRQAGFEGHDILEAETGKEGLEVVGAEQPDLILSDWHMPEMTGIEFLQALNTENINIPFGFAAVALIHFNLIEPQQEGKRHAFDFGGVATLSAALTCFLVALIQAGKTGTFTEPNLLALFAVGP